MIGRTEVINRLLAAPAGVTLVTGDSGIGKTRVLEGAVEGEASPLYGKAPYVCSHDEMLQEALLGALGREAGLLAEMRTGIDLIERLTAAVKKLAKKHLSQVPFILYRQVLAVAAQHTGVSLVEISSELHAQLRDGSPEDIAEKAMAERGRLARELFNDLAATLVEVSDREVLTLAIDTLADLTDADARHLIAVAESSSEFLSIWITVNTAAQASRATVDRLCRQSVHINEIPIAPLSEEAVRSILSDAGANPRGYRRIHRVSNGYPLVVEQLLKQGEVGPGEELIAPGSEKFVDLVGQSLAELTPAARLVAKKLALLRDPPPMALSARLLGVDEPTLFDAEFLFRRSRLFSVRLSNQWWFHERRRQAVVDHLLSSAEHEALSGELAEEIAGMAAEFPIAPRWLLPLKLSAPALEAVCVSMARSQPHSDAAWRALCTAIMSGPYDGAMKELIFSKSIEAGAASMALIQGIGRRLNRKIRINAIRTAIAQGVPVSPTYSLLYFEARGRRAAEGALENGSADPQVLAAALQCVKKSAARRHARALLDSKDPALLSVCFAALGEAAASRAREVLADPEISDYVKAPALSALPIAEAQGFAADLLPRASEAGVVTRCLQILGEKAEPEARRLVSEESTPSDVTCAALRCLPAPVAETVSLDLLSKWPAEEHDVICTCLEFAGERGSAYAQQTLEAPERYPKEVIARALALHGAKMPELVGQLLKPSTEEEVQCRAIEVLGQEATPYARKLLSAWRDAPATVLVRCFQVTKESEESKRAAQEMVEQFGTIPVQLRPAALRSAPDSDLRRRLAEEVLANWERRDRRLVTSAMTAFWNDPATAAPACRQILKKVQRELPHQSPRRRWKYDGHISKALANPCCEEEARRAAGQILSAPKSRASPTLRKVAQATLDGSHMPWSNAFAKQADAS